MEKTEAHFKSTTTSLNNHPKKKCKPIRRFGQKLISVVKESSTECEISVENIFTFTVHAKKV